MSGAVSCASSTATIVTEAIAIIRTETAQVPPPLISTIAAAANGTSSAANRSGDLVAERRAAVAQVRGKHFAEKTSLNTVHDTVPDGHSNNESQDYNDRVACRNRPKNGERKTDSGNASNHIDRASTHAIGETSE